MVHKMDWTGNNPWRLEDDEEFTSVQKPKPEAKAMASADKTSEKSAWWDISVGVGAIGLFGLACGLFVACFMLPIKVLGWYFP